MNGLMRHKPQCDSFLGPLPKTIFKDAKGQSQVDIADALNTIKDTLENIQNKEV